MDERFIIWHARLSLREAADVLRMYRRAARGGGNAHVNAELGSLQQIDDCLRKSSRTLCPGAYYANGE